MCCKGHSFPALSRHLSNARFWLLSVYHVWMHGCTNRNSGWSGSCLF